MNKKMILIGILVFIFIIGIGILYLQSKNNKSNLKSLNTTININSEKKEIYGNVISINEKNIKIKEFLNVPCFYQWDYMDENLTIEEENKKYNPENLPWCEDPSGGTLYKYTNKEINFEFNPKTVFSLVEIGKGMRFVSKEEFIKFMNNPSENEVKITAVGSIVEKIEEMYED